MMYTSHSLFGYGLLWGLHIIAVVAFFIGIVFLVALALRTFSQPQLKRWGIGLLVISIVICLITIAVKGSPWIGYGGKGSMMHKETMQGQHMSMDTMVSMLHGKTGDDFDEMFIRMMIPHHEGAIVMAEMALTSAHHEEIKRMAHEIISAQRDEIDEMLRWMVEWGYVE